MPESRQPPSGFEDVHVELEWWDGPRMGLADVGGVPHYFSSIHDYDHPNDEFFVWPASDIAVAWEREQWAIFVEWNNQYQAGTATTATHPANPGTNARYDELQTLLEPHRAKPEHPRRLAADWHHGDGAERYLPAGPVYRVQWRPLAG